MKAWYILRWVANTAKLRGHTIRKSPSELSYDLILSDGRWFRFPSDPHKGETFAVEITEGDKEDRLKLAERVEKEGTIQLEPGEFGNPLKGAFVFYELIWSGEPEILEDSPMTLQIKLGNRKRIVLVKRPQTKHEWRSFPGSPPGSVRKMLRSFQSEGQALLDATADEVFRPGTDPKMRFVRHGEYWEMLDVPIATPGIWNGVNVTEALLRRLIENFYRLRDRLYVPLKLGHGTRFVENERKRTSGEPALGWVRDLRWDGESRFLRADFTRVPRAVVECIKKGAFTGISIEIDPDFAGYGDTLVGVALLGADLPAMTSLPKLLKLYQRFGGATYSVGGGRMNEETKITAMDHLLGLNPMAVLAFSLKDVPKEMAEELVQLLRSKGYPTVLAKELLDLMASPDRQKVELMPAYDATMWKPRLRTLEKRADLPEKCEDVIKELEEFLEMHKEELDDEDKALAERILEKAKRNLPAIEVEEEYPKAEAEAAEGAEAGPDTHGAAAEGQAQVKGSSAEKYEEEYPSAAEKYPEEGPRVKVLDQVKLREAEEFQRLLREKALEALEAKVRYLQACGLSPDLVAEVREALMQLDPALTPEPDRMRLQNIVLRLASARPPSQTFQRLVPLEPPQEEDLAQLILRHSRKHRR